jgi:hypothetical protein
LERSAGEPTVLPFDSPIGIEPQPLSAAEKSLKKKGRRVSARFTLTNRTGRMIRAYSMLVTNNGETWLQSAVWWGSTHRTVERVGSQGLVDPQFSVWTVDWVLFEDGSSWGPDEMGQEPGIRSWVRGFEAAREQAFALARPEEAEVVRSILDNGGYIPHSLRLPSTLPPDYGKSHYSWGYRFGAGMLSSDRFRRPAAQRVGALLKEIHDAGLSER